MKFMMLLCGSLLFAGVAQAAQVETPVNAITADGIGQQIGVIVFSDSPSGLVMDVDVTGLTPGGHGMHIHEVGDCGPGMADGKPVAGLAAKGHFDPGKTGTHKGPAGEGHKGDLPLLNADDKGAAKAKLTAPHLTLEDVKGRAVIIHAGGDNYADAPSPLGGGGARIACGVIR